MTRPEQWDDPDERGNATMAAGAIWIALRDYDATPDVDDDGQVLPSLTIALSFLGSRYRLTIERVLTGDEGETGTAGLAERWGSLAEAVDLHDALIGGLAAAVCEAYDNEGVGIWWRSWVHAGPAERQAMAHGVLAEWSGQS